MRSIMQILSTNLAQGFGVNPSVETVWNQYTVSESYRRICGGDK